MTEPPTRPDDRPAAGRTRTAAPAPPSPHDDRSTPDLVAHARAGDRVAFARLVARHEARVRAVALSVGVALDATDDVAQETFVAVFRGLSTLSEDGSFAPWVAGIAHHQAVSWLRRAGRAPPARDDLERLADPAGDPGRSGDPHERLERETRRDDVRRALLDLPDRERLALCLKHHAGLSYAEIGETMTLPTTTIKGLLERGTRALRALLAPPRERARPT